MTIQEMQQWLNAPAVTRKGVPYSVTDIQTDVAENVTTVKGTITVDNQQVEMFWNANGQSLATDFGYDLVHNTPFAPQQQ